MGAGFKGPSDKELLALGLIVFSLPGMVVGGAIGFALAWWLL